jgi:hypothetical protein
MKVSINGQDYTSWLDAANPLTIQRKLNQPSRCELWLSLPAGGSVATPAFNQSVSVTGDDGTLYFTGYIATRPVPAYAGMALEGPHYRMFVEASSDELLLDQLSMSPTKGAAGMSAGALLTALVARTGSASLSTQAVSVNLPLSDFVPEPGAPWSKSAGQVASQMRAAYRVLGGALSLSQIPCAIHPLNEADGSLKLAGLSLTSEANRALANDVTICGEHEPLAYVTEYFPGDGTTTRFDLTEQPFAIPAAKQQIIRELFNGKSIDLRVWSATGGAGCFSLGPGGLTMNGGNGIDGQTQLTWLEQVEMGGTLLLEAVGLVLSTGSAGMIGGLSTGVDTASGCIAGFQATAQAGTGAVSLQPVVMGSAAGISYAVSPCNQYTLRLRLYCSEQERLLATYYSYGDSGSITYGGEGSNVPAKIQMELQETVNGVAGMPVTLYDGSIAGLPPSCTIVAASSVSLSGTLRGINLNNLGTCWVVSTPADKGAYTRRIGSIAESAECQVGRTGQLTFYSGFAPQAGEQIAVTYRTRGRAVGRAVNSSSQATLAGEGLPTVATWIGSVTDPPTRSSADCRNAALTMVSASGGVTALLSGTYKSTQLSFACDVWPGDALLLNAPSVSLNSEVVVRSVKVTYAGSCPDLLSYWISFANDWANDLAIKTSATVPDDAWLPAAIEPTVLANLTSLSVTAINATSITINTGTAPPAGGGFEIRRRDFTFVPGVDPDLVMRGSQQNMTFSRQSAHDQFYIRMYDGSTPPNYSEFSTGLFINLPLSS